MNLATIRESEGACKTMHKVPLRAYLPVIQDAGAPKTYQKNHMYGNKHVPVQNRIMNSSVLCELTVYTVTLAHFDLLAT
jgi:hypothetical protein